MGLCLVRDLCQIRGDFCPIQEQNVQTLGLCLPCPRMPFLCLYFQNLFSLDHLLSWYHIHGRHRTLGVALHEGFVSHMDGHFQMVVHHGSEAVGPLSEQVVDPVHPQETFFLPFLLEMFLQV